MASVISLIEGAFGICFGTSTLLPVVTDQPSPPWEGICTGPITFLYQDNSDGPGDVHVIGDRPIRALPWSFSISC